MNSTCSIIKSQLFHGVSVAFLESLGQPPRSRLVTRHGWKRRTASANSCGELADVEVFSHVTQVYLYKSYVYNVKCCDKLSVWVYIYIQNHTEEYRFIAGF